MRFRFRLMLPLLLLLTCVSAHAEMDWYGVYPESRWMRVSPNITANAVMQLPAWTLIHFTGEAGDFYACEALGKAGYIHRLGAEAIAYAAPKESDAQEGGFAEDVALRSAPTDSAPAVMTLQPGLRLKIFPVNERFALLRYNGQEGYVPLDDWQRKTYAELPITPAIRFVKNDTQVYAAPTDGADPAWTLPADTPATAEAANGDTTRIRLNDQVGYLKTELLREPPQDEPIRPMVVRTKRAADYRAYPLLGCPIGGQFAKDEPIVITALNGSFARAAFGTEARYLPTDALRREGSLAAMLEEREQQISEQRVLNAALSLVEQSNPLLLRYQAQGGDTQARFVYGVPYYFGGMNGNLLLRPWVMHTNSLYYVKGQRYLYGFDCIGFARWVCKAAGLNRPVRISSMPWESARLVDVHGLPLNRWHERLHIGDLVAMGKSKGYHVGMYIGTLRSFGYTEAELGQLTAFIDHPLLIHSGMNDFHTEWYRAYMAEHHIRGVLLPDGGVTISLLSDSDSGAEASVTLWEDTPNEKTFHYNLLEGYHLTRMNLKDANIRWYVVYRSGRK